ncbi:MAG: hypothetical protein E6Q66_01625 [Pedobacter sp.]|nr:MAG: hypothetical protein E6Q66_01625 [Pedobacter sp.]
MRQKNSSLGKRDLNKIRRSLPKGWQNQSAAMTNKSHSTVSMVMIKKRNNTLVIQQAIELCNLPEQEKTILKIKLNPVL